MKRCKFYLIMIVILLSLSSLCRGADYPPQDHGGGGAGGASASAASSFGGLSKKDESIDHKKDGIKRASPNGGTVKLIYTGTPPNLTGVSITSGRSYTGI